jgi:hypothetical protein
MVSYYMLDCYFVVFIYSLDWCFCGCNFIYFFLLWLIFRDATSGSQLRSSKDIQFAHAYYYFMAEEKVPYDWDEIWQSIDKDRNGYSEKSDG